jgi:hypothetical protein
MRLACHDRPLVPMDEVGALFKGNKEMAQIVRAVLNAGAHYESGVSLRGQGH